MYFGESALEEYKNKQQAVNESAGIIYIVSALIGYIGGKFLGAHIGAGINKIQMKDPKLNDIWKKTYQFCQKYAKEIIDQKYHKYLSFEEYDVNKVFTGSGHFLSIYGFSLDNIAVVDENALKADGLYDEFYKEFASKFQSKTVVEDENYKGFVKLGNHMITKDGKRVIIADISVSNIRDKK